MKHRQLAMTLAAIAAIPLVPVGRLHAQTIDGSVIAMTTAHDLMSDGLFGFGVSAVANVAPRVALRAGAEHVTGTAHRPGILCAGLVMPGTCVSEEPVRDDARLTTAVGGVDARVLGSSARNLSLAGAVRLGLVHAESFGATSGRTLEDSKVLIGGELGLQALWGLGPRSPLSLVLSGTVGEMRPLVKEQSPDAYNPFWTDFNVGRAQFAVRWNR